MSRITAVRSIAVRPSALLEVALLRRGQLVVEHDGVGVDVVAQLAQLVDLAPTDVGGRIGRVAALHDSDRPRRRRRCRPAARARRAIVSVSSSWSGGSVTPTRTMRSRKVRSMRPPRLTAELAEPAAVAESRHPAPRSWAMSSAGPTSTTSSPSRTSAAPPGISTVTTSPTSPTRVRGVRRRARARCRRRWVIAGASLPHAQHDRVGSTAVASAMNSTFMPSANCCSSHAPACLEVDRLRSRRSRSRDGGCPCRPWCADRRARSSTGGGTGGPGCAGPIVTLTCARFGAGWS